MLVSIASSLIVAGALAAPAADRLFERQARPTVTIQNGTVVGSSAGGVESFKGIPFAQPPVGPLRLKPPQPITESFGTIQAVGIPDSCPQFYVQIDTSTLVGDVIADLIGNPAVQAATQSSEDCLTLNVQRPTGTTADSKLPVLLWLFGGGFEFGSNQLYDGTPFVTKSVGLGKDIIYVAINYRVGGFGFLAGQELQADGSTNLGLRDQRLALQWVQDNIEAFGGDPEKVTIWGESAGAISAFDQTIINGGDNTYNGRPLFRAAIMNSGSLVPAQDVSSEKAQNIYDTVVRNAGCSGQVDTLSCLRGLSTQDFLSAANNVPAIFGYRSVDLSYLPRPDPSDDFFPESPDAAVAAGRVAKVPVIIGDQEDEGTLFSLVQLNITTDAALTAYLQSYFPATDPQVVADLVASYPSAPSAGSPFRTSIANEIRPQFKRLAAILGDITFTLTRRVYLDLIVPQIPAAYTYLNTYLFGTPVLGTFHASDVLVNFFSLLPITADKTRQYYINFAADLDPNSAVPAGAPAWPEYTSAQRPLLQFAAGGFVTVGKDDFRQAQFKVLAGSASSLTI
ncbi:Alpha/Beta hydrolase protein [Macrophomina phaseolina]|uniref:Carboxylic ester hydrolase n=1 Tax=Macrophomina phaseolina TaxID=35725 RepID=A0ABQ8GDF9_9PEZI|nr:Alpha/Beta hydrolase protein [Macrophomina phaseolina]